MILTSEEMIGLNSLLDGKKIWGFHENIAVDLDIAMKKRIAAKLLKFGEKEIEELLFYLNTYKTADDYVVINELNIALADRKMFALIKLKEGYQFSVIDKEQIKKYVRGKENIMLFRFKNNDICGFNILTTENGMMIQNMQQSEIDELVERYLE